MPTSLVWVPDWTHDGTCARVLQLSPSDIRDDLDDYPWIKIFTKEVHEGCDEEDYYDLTAVGQDPMICGIAAVEKALYPDDENPMDDDEDAEEYYYRQLSFYADLHDQVMRGSTVDLLNPALFTHNNFLSSASGSPAAV